VIRHGLTEIVNSLLAPPSSSLGMLQQARGPGVLDPDIAAFAADQDETFDRAFYARPIEEQRAFYEAFWRRYHAPRPAGIEIADFNIRGRTGDIPARLYMPTRASGPAPVIVYCHGGSWMFGGLDSHDLPAARLALHSEAAVLAIDYRLAPEHKYPAALHDAWDALTWVAEQGGERKLDPRRLAVAGDSAGGALAAGMALMARDGGRPPMRAQGLIYPALRPAGPLREQSAPAWTRQPSPARCVPIWPCRAMRTTPMQCR
jgi:acetyl esterase